MSTADILFQYYTTDVNATITVADLAFTSPLDGVTMITAIYAAPTEGGTSNVYRIHHCGPEEQPATTNLLIMDNASTKTSSYTEQKIIMRPGDRLFCGFDSGNAITITGFGIKPVPVRTQNVEEGVPPFFDHAAYSKYMQDQALEVLPESAKTLLRRGGNTGGGSY